MRYIKKQERSEAAQLLNDWIERRIAAEQNLLYVDFDKKKELNEHLRLEQRGVCCYCQQRITHYQDDNDGGSHNEHLIPENGEPDSLENQVVYNNLYAACNYSSGRSKRDEYCAISKHNKPITPFIQRTDCDKYFKYNLNGEILPTGPYNTIAEFKEHIDDLTDDQKDAYNTICILNLNHNSIKQLRKGDQEKLFGILNSMTKRQVEAKIQIINNTDQYPRFIDMLLYYMKQKK